LSKSNSLTSKVDGIITWKKKSCPFLDSSAAWSAVVKRFSMLMSAPAMNPVVLPEMRTAALAAGSDWNFLKTTSMSFITSSFNEFTCEFFYFFFRH
jgi:hypothetical protein